MNMTDEQKYSAVLRELGEVLQNKNTTISCLQWQIEELKARLEAAEDECAKAVARAKVLDQQLKGAYNNAE